MKELEKITYLEFYPGSGLMSYALQHIPLKDDCKIALIIDDISERHYWIKERDDTYHSATPIYESMKDIDKDIKHIVFIYPYSSNVLNAREIVTSSTTKLPANVKKITIAAPGKLKDRELAIELSDEAFSMKRVSHTSDGFFYILEDIEKEIEFTENFLI